MSQPDTWLIEPYDAPGRYLVACQSQEGKYLVDLLAYEGHGQCSCADWTYRIGPCRQAEQEPPKRFCKHIAICREHFTDTILQRMIQAAKAGPSSAGQASSA